MKLDKPSLQLSVSKEDALAQVKGAAEEKGYPAGEMEIAELSLLYVPFFVFNYEAFQESKTEESETPVVSETENGRMVLNAFSSELDGEIVPLFEEEESSIENSPGDNEDGEEIKFEMQKARLKEEEAKQIAQVKMAAQLSLGKGNIIISAMELVYVPFWLGSAKVGEEEYSIEINAVSGAMKGLEELPERGKSYGELTKETVSELKDPAAWVNYIVSIIADTAKWIWNSAPVKWFIEQLATNRRMQIAILLSIIMLIGLKELRYI